MRTTCVNFRERISVSELQISDDTDSESLVTSYALSDIQVPVSSVNSLHEQLKGTALPAGTNVYLHSWYTL